MVHQKVTLDFPTAGLPQIGAVEGNRTLVVSLEGIWKTASDQSRRWLSLLSRQIRIASRLTERIYAQ
jgi:hypothetical protein